MNIKTKPSLPHMQKTSGRKQVTPISLQYSRTHNNSNTPNIIVRSMPDSTEIGLIHYSFCDKTYSYHPYPNVFCYYSASLLKSLYMIIKSLDIEGGE